MSVRHPVNARGETATHQKQKEAIMPVAENLEFALTRQGANTKMDQGPFQPVLKGIWLDSEL
jgi:hypothetical protein